MKDKKILIAIISLIFLTAVLLVGFAWNKKAIVEKPSIKKEAVIQKESAVKKETVKNSEDTDTKAIENDLDSVSDDDFNDETLSDSAVGL